MGQVHTRARAAGAVLRRLLSGRHFRRDWRADGGRRRDADRLVGDAAPAADHAAGHRGHRRDLRLADADPARRDADQGQANRALPAVRRGAVRRPGDQEAAAEDHVRRRFARHRGRLATPHLALGGGFRAARGGAAQTELPDGAEAGRGPAGVAVGFGAGFTAGFEAGFEAGITCTPSTTAGPFSVSVAVSMAMA